MGNAEIARIFNEMADIVELQGGNPFRVRSYRNAARTLENLPEPAEQYAAQKELEALPGIGSGLAEKIRELIETGRCEEHASLLEKIPSGLLELLKIQRLGPKKVRQLYEELNISNLEGLEAAVRNEEIRHLAGMGAKTEENIKKGIAFFRQNRGRYLLSEALPYAESIISTLKDSAPIQQIDLAGSLRRCRESVRDVDILVASKHPAEVAAFFTQLEEIDEVLAKGLTKISVRLRSGLQVDLRVIEAESYGAALHYFTGSKEHNVAIRDRGKQRGLRISEYGAFREETGERIGGARESEIFEAVGLPYIPPELRENWGEIKAAEEGALPELVDLAMIKGDLQVHTQETDGADSIEEMALAARDLGYEYIAITDHSKAVRVANGMNEERLRQHMEAIDRVNDGIHGIAVLKGVEVDILKDGRLDLDERLLAELDIVVASIHTNMALPEKEMTDRIVRAFRSGVVDVFAHPTGRKIGERGPYALDLDQVLEEARANGVFLEVNASPERLDLKDVHCQLVRERGLPVVISTDAHSRHQLRNMRYGVATARRGWLAPDDVLNTMGYETFLEALGSRRKQR